MRRPRVDHVQPGDTRHSDLRRARRCAPPPPPRGRSLRLLGSRSFRSPGRPRARRLAPPSRRGCVPRVGPAARRRRLPYRLSPRGRCLDCRGGPSSSLCSAPPRGLLSGLGCPERARPSPAGLGPRCRHSGLRRARRCAPPPPPRGRSLCPWGPPVPCGDLLGSRSFRSPGPPRARRLAPPSRRGCVPRVGPAIGRRRLPYRLSPRGRFRLGRRRRRLRPSAGRGICMAFCMALSN